MFDLGGGEMLLIGIVALLVVGPKELPALFRKVGEFTGKARSMAREFTSAMNAAADQTGMSDLNKTLKGVTKPMSYAADRLRETTGLATASLNAAKPVPVSPAAFKPGSETGKLADAQQDKRAALAETTAKLTQARQSAASQTEAASPVAVAAAAAADAPAAKPRKSRAKPKLAPDALPDVQT